MLRQSTISKTRDIWHIRHIKYLLRPKKALRYKSGKLNMLRMDAGNIGTDIVIADIGSIMVAGESLLNHGLLYDPDANEFFVWGKKKSVQNFGK